MTDHVLINDDIIIFPEYFGLAKVIVTVGIVKIKGSAKALVNGKKVCLKGDEEEVSVRNCVYTTAAYSLPGLGTIKIEPFQDGDDHISEALVIDNKPALLKGGKFKAVFSVEVKAKTPPPSSTPDPIGKYEAQGNFSTNDTMKWRSK